MDMAYPGVMNGNIVYDDRLLRMQLDQRCEFIRRYNRPCLVGEFGLRGNHPHRAQDRERVLRDQLRYFNECGYSWTVWNHKDVGLRGLLYAAPDSPWMKFTDRIRHLKEVFSTDLAVPITESYMLNRIKEPILECYPDLENSTFSFERTHLDEMLMVHMSDILLAVLCIELSRCSCAELEELNASWKFENVCIRKGWESILRQYLTEGRQ